MVKLFHGSFSSLDSLSELSMQLDWLLVSGSSMQDK